VPYVVRVGLRLQRGEPVQLRLMRSANLYDRQHRAVRRVLLRRWYVRDQLWGERRLRPWPRVLLRDMQLRPDLDCVRRIRVSGVRLPDVVQQRFRLCIGRFVPVGQLRDLHGNGGGMQRSTELQLRGGLPR
jgi:hypothetical protein